MKPVTVRNITIGEGMPKICVPIVAEKKEEILEAAKQIVTLPVDVVEWRVDWFEEGYSSEAITEVLQELRPILGQIPLLFTFRTKTEGGEKTILPQLYSEILIAAAQTGMVDLVDVEIFTGDKTVRRIIKKVHRAEVKVIASNHDFEKTPAKGEIVRRLCKMQLMGADILKIAVMPQSDKDVLTLLAATEKMKRKYAKRPLITMSMSGRGVVSRLCGETFGSALTFGAAEKASAPGQVDVKALREVLEVIHGAV